MSLRRDLRSIVADGVAYSTMVGLGEAYIPAFVLAAGLGNVASGLVATVPMLLGAFLQLATPRGIRWLGSYRRWTVACARLQALSLVPLVVGAARGDVQLLWIAAATVAYWTFGMSTGPAWNAWVTTLVPSAIRARFFATRTRAAQAALVAGLVTGGLALEFGRNRGQELTVFAALFAAAIVARGLSSVFLARQSEAPGLAAGLEPPNWGVLWHRLRAAGSLRVLTYLLAMQAATHIASPYFTPYMLQPLAFSYHQFMALTGTAFLARIAVLPVLGRIAHQYGTRRILWLGGVGVVPLPSLWLVSHDFHYLMGVQLLAGAAWASVELATTLSFFEGIGEKDRANVLSVFNFANALASALGALVGAQILGGLELGASTYAWLFGVSTAARFTTLLLIRRAPSVEHPSEEVRLRTLAIRPSGVALQRPILASLDSEREAAAEAPAAD